MLNSAVELLLEEYSVDFDGMLCDSCDKVATRIICDENNEYCASWFLGHYCETCCCDLEFEFQFQHYLNNTKSIQSWDNYLKDNNE